MHEIEHAQLTGEDYYAFVVRTAVRMLRDGVDPAVILRYLEARVTERQS